MELVYPFVIFIGIPIIIFLIVLNIKKPHVYKEGKKVANTKYIKEIPYYNDVIKKYKILSYLIKIICIISIFLSLLLLARPATEDTNNNPLYNRDIFLCIDVSQSLDQVNEEVIKNLNHYFKREGLSSISFGSIFHNPSSSRISFP